MGSVVGVQNKFTHFVFRFFKYKFYVYNSNRVKGKFGLTKKYFGILGFYFFKNLKKFSESIVIDGKQRNFELEDWIDYRIVRRKEICGCLVDFKKYPKGPCPCGNPNKLIEINNEGTYRSNTG